jgi:hypothetical protein|nr:hypothetical protein Q903MT_gene2619 [Picea sitchensis]
MGLDLQLALDGNSRKGVYLNDGNNMNDGHGCNLRDRGYRGCC